MWSTTAVNFKSSAQRLDDVPIVLSLFWHEPDYRHFGYRRGRQSVFVGHWRHQTQSFRIRDSKGAQEEVFYLVNCWVRERTLRELYSNLVYI